MNEQELTDWLRGLAAEIKRTKPHYPTNVVPGCPIPFFGNIFEALVLTVGVNPSSTEFDSSRKWREAGTLPKWQERMLNYFRQRVIPSHEWFETWSICLEFLAISYASGTAAHLDVSPRPTNAMIRNAKTNQQEFRAMVQHDIKWFFELLAEVPQARLLLIAGPIPRADGTKQQLADFIREHSQKHGCQWISSKPLPRLITRSHPAGIPAFVCPYEPKVDGLYAMIRQVYRNRQLLRSLAGSCCDSEQICLNSVKTQKGPRIVTV
jgi:hypothetical protein